MAWVEKRRSGWYVRWRHADGRKPAAGPYGSKGQATAAAAEYDAGNPPVRRGRAGGPRPVEPLTIAQVAALWRADRMADAERMERPGAREYLDDAHARIVAVAASWGTPAAPATPADATMVRAIALRKRDPRTSASMRAILRWARGHHGTPFDPQVDVALRPPPSKRARVDRLTDREAKVILARARRLGQLPIISCLMVYGWRPITACRRNVGHVDLKRGTIEIDRKHGTPLVHPLFRFHVEMLRPLVEGRPPEAPLFVPPRWAKTKAGDAHQREKDRWAISATGSAGMLAVWFRRKLLAGVGSYQLKRLALSRMLAGEWPWKRPLSPEEIRLYTGQKSDAIVLRYERTNLDRARGLMSEGQ